VLVKSAVSSTTTCVMGDILSFAALKGGNPFTSPITFTSRNDECRMLALVVFGSLYRPLLCFCLRLVLLKASIKSRRAL
jgi:hypothetical protein